MCIIHVHTNTCIRCIHLCTHMHTCTHTNTPSTLRFRDASRLLSKFVNPTRTKMVVTNSGSIFLSTRKRLHKIKCRELHTSYIHHNTSCIKTPFSTHKNIQYTAQLIILFIIVSFNSKRFMLLHFLPYDIQTPIHRLLGLFDQYLCAYLI